MTGTPVAPVRRMSDRTVRLPPDGVELAQAVVPLDDTTRAYDRLLAAVGDARFVLLGAATHGSHELYRERAEVTQRLIVEKGFDAVAVEADWPDAHRVHAFIQGRGDDRTAEAALGDFERFPRWIWRNTDVRDFVTWLHANAPHVGFYGLDLYSLQSSIDVVLAYLDTTDPEGARRARARYSCFAHTGRTSNYALAVNLGLTESCERAVTSELMQMHQRLRGSKRTDSEELLFEVEQNARLVKDAEEYYRTMLSDDVKAWNIRDRHMVDTLEAIAEHLDEKLGRRSRLVVWAHNWHLGDARATELSTLGEVSVGQLLREAHGDDAFLVGFTTYEGFVMAAPDWGQKPADVPLHPAVPDSHERLLHEVVTELDVAAAVVLPGADGLLPAALREDRLERSVPAVARPHAATERPVDWFVARPGEQFDALVHVDRSTAVVPLDEPRTERLNDTPDTFPSAY